MFPDDSRAISRIRFGVNMTGKTDGHLDEFDGDQAYGIYGQYDLGGGATVNGGLVRAYKHALEQADGTLDFDNPVIADFGVVMSF